MTHWRTLAIEQHAEVTAAELQAGIAHREAVEKRDRERLATKLALLLGTYVSPAQVAFSGNGNAFVDVDETRFYMVNDHPSFCSGVIMIGLGKCEVCDKALISQPVNTLVEIGAVLVKGPAAALHHACRHDKDDGAAGTAMSVSRSPAEELGEAFIRFLDRTGAHVGAANR